MPTPQKPENAGPIQVYPAETGQASANITTNTTPMETKKTYKYKDIDMLTATNTLIQHFNTHKKELTSARPTWADPFITNLQTRVNNAMNTLANDNRKVQKEATLAVSKTFENAKNALSTFKIQLEADFKKDKPRLQWILDTLGYTRHWKQAQKGDQEALIQLLYAYKINMNSQLKAEITAKGIPAKLIDSIGTHADLLKANNTTQETQKGNSRVMTATMRAELNSIYAEAINIATVSRNLYRTQPSISTKFSFSKLVSDQNFSGGSGESETATGQ